MGNSKDFKQQKDALIDAGNRVVRRPLGRLDPKMTRKGGPRSKYTERTLLNAVNKYFNWSEQNDEIPTIKGMMLHLKLYPSYFYEMIKNPKFADILETARMYIANWAEIDVYLTPGQASGKIAFMKNIHGWSDKVETKNQTEVTQKMTVEEAKGQIEALAPLLLQELGNQRVVEQMGQTIEDAEIVVSK